MDNGIYLPWEAVSIVLIILGAMWAQSRAYSKQYSDLEKKVIVMETNQKNMKETSARQYDEIVENFREVFKKLEDISQTVHLAQASKD